MLGSQTHDIIIELIDSVKENYQKKAEIMKGSEFVFESIELMDYKLNKVRLKRGGHNKTFWMVKK